jgi:hypothetical protein
VFQIDEVSNQVENQLDSNQQFQKLYQIDEDQDCHLDQKDLNCKNEYKNLSQNSSSKVLQLFQS